uniref:Acyl-CoA thioesterase II n=1 Tax=Bursaphelenchus xylophilus TaxID=6326 RepID=A0A1I7S9L9_BURXY
MQNLIPIDDFYRSPARHYGGAFNEHRLFGGQCVAQMYLATKRLRPGFLPNRIDVKFLRPGTTLDPVDYFAPNLEMDSHHVVLEAKQSGKVLNRGHLRVANKKYAKGDTVKPLKSFDVTTLPPPAECSERSTMIAPSYVNAWLESHGYQKPYTDGLERESVFEIRPIRLYDYEKERRQQPLLMWMRLSNSVRDCEVDDPLFAPLIFSDFLVGLPAEVILNEKPGHMIPSMASMDHKVIIHKHDGFDPKAFFVVMQQVEVATDMVILHGTIMTKQGKPVISYVQQSLYQKLLPLTAKL